MRRLFILFFCAQFFLCSGLLTSLQTLGAAPLQDAQDSVQQVSSAAPEASQESDDQPSADALDALQAALTDLPHEEPNLFNTLGATMHHGMTATAYPSLDVAVQAPPVLEGPQRPPRASRGSSVLI